ncbi:hypothetical protein JADG_001495 [Aureobasidium aubasidani]|nr:hypothetical protein JADG_001495 [Aureobasidium pullulans]
MSGNEEDNGASLSRLTSNDSETKPNVFKTVWRNNKGVFLILLAQATGSTMDAIVRFLQQGGHAWACSVFLGQTFSRTEFAAGVIALLGVVIIAHPAAIFGRVDDDIELPHKPNKIDDVSSGQRLLAIFVSVIGVLGASAAYTLIRVIGSRAHALISVNYFALISTFGSAGALLVLPGMGFTMPHGAREWLLLSLLGVLGFVLQFLLTAGLQLDRTSKATSMLYTGILFALAFDWAIWGVFPGFWSCIGGAVVIASTLWSALQKSKSASVGASPKKEVIDEESALLGTQTEGSEEAARAGAIRNSV